MRTRIVSFVWGFSEAIFFFLVPDIWLTRIAIAGLGEAAVNALVALAGALLGGALLYVLGGMYFDTIGPLLDHVPAISGRMIGEVGSAVHGGHPLRSIVQGGFTGVPFKIYAAWAGQAGLSFPAFLLAAAVGRLARFLAAILAAYAVIAAIGRRLSRTGLLWTHGVSWTIFYGFYFYAMGF